MRTIIDLPENDVTALDKLAEHGRSSRAEVIRRAVVLYLHLHPSRQQAVDAAFGLLKGRVSDGRAFEDEIRGDWERES